MGFEVECQPAESDATSTASAPEFGANRPAVRQRPILEVTDLGKQYSCGSDRVDALRGVFLTAEPGEFVAVMGASGSGKSTLLHLLAGLDRPTSGAIRMEGRDLAQMTDRERTVFRRRRLGLVFQAYNLLPTLSALENVSLPLLLDGLDDRDGEQKAREMLERVDLGHRLHHRPQALSGGEQQRVAIARALINDPVLILADEPTGNLDTAHAAEIWKLLNGLSREDGRTVITVTHEADGAAFADRIVALKDGHVVGEIRLGAGGLGEHDAALVATRYRELVG